MATEPPDDWAGPGNLVDATTSAVLAIDEIRHRIRLRQSSPMLRQSFDITELVTILERHGL